MALFIRKFAKKNKCRVTKKKKNSGRKRKRVLTMFLTWNLFFGRSFQPSDLNYQSQTPYAVCRSVNLNQKFNKNKSRRFVKINGQLVNQKSLFVNGGANNSAFNQSHEEYLEKLISKKLKSLDVEREFERVLKLSEISKFKKFYRSIIVEIENSPELIRKSLVMLSQFEKPLPYSIDARLKPYDSLGILNRKSVGLIVNDVTQKPKYRYEYQNDFEFRLEQEKSLQNRRRLFSVGDSGLPAKKTNGGKNQENLLKPSLIAPYRISPLTLSISNSNEGVDIPTAYTNSDAISEARPTSLTNIQARSRVIEKYGTKTNPKFGYIDEKIGLKAPYQVFANKAKHGLSYKVDPLLYYSESDLQILNTYGLVGYVERGCDFPSKAFTDTFFANSQSFYHRNKKSINFHGAFRGKRAIIVHQVVPKTKDGGPVLIFDYDSKELWVPHHLSGNQMKRYLKTGSIGNQNQEVIPGTQPPLHTK